MEVESSLEVLTPKSQLDSSLYNTKQFNMGEELIRLNSFELKQPAYGLMFISRFYLVCFLPRLLNSNGRSPYLQTVK